MASTALAASLARRNIHYGWVVVATTFLTMLVTAAAMGTPGVLIVPLEHEFGWSDAQISSALALRILLYGLFGPFAAAFMNRFGVRRVIVAACVLIGGAFLVSLGDDAGLAAHPVVGHGGRRRHRAHRDGVGGDGGDTLVQSPPRPGHRHAGGEFGDRPAHLPAAHCRAHHPFRLAHRARLRVGGARHRRNRSARPDARPAERSRSAALRRNRRCRRHRPPASALAHC